MANQELAVEVRAKVGPSDVVQETMLLAQENFDQFAGQTDAELFGWLRRIMLNQLADEKKKYRRQKRDVAREMPMHGDSRTGVPPMDFPGDFVTPGTRAIAEEQTETVMRALQRLPDDSRQAIVLRSLERLSFAEVGKQLGRSEDAARKLWSRAVERLQQELEESM